MLPDSRSYQDPSTCCTPGTGFGPQASGACSQQLQKLSLVGLPLSKPNHHTLRKLQQNVH